MKKWIKNSNGSILLEVLGGMTILLILSLSFATAVTQAHMLFLQASVNSREWEKVFVKMESKNYKETPTSPATPPPALPTTDGEAFKMRMTLSTIKGGDVVLAKKADGTRPGMSDSAVTRGEFTFTPEFVFRQYKHVIETSQSTGTQEVYAYRIMKK